MYIYIYVEKARSCLSYETLFAKPFDVFVCTNIMLQIHDMTYYSKHPVQYIYYIVI